MQDADINNWSFWSTLSPELSAPAQTASAAPAPLTIDPAALAAASASMDLDGYLQLAPVFTPTELRPVLDTLFKLQSVNLPPVFIYVYTQPWHIFQRLRPLISHFLGDHFSLLPNFWAWHIPAIQGASGWQRHRDYEGETRFESPDGGQSLMSLSLWLPLTDATSDNGCMHIHPRSWGKYQDTVTGRALPAKAGSVLGWTQDLYHWSGDVQAGATSPRISLSLEFQNSAFAPMADQLLDIDAPPSFEERLALVRQQIPKYRHMTEPPSPV